MNKIKWKITFHNNKDGIYEIPKEIREKTENIRDVYCYENRNKESQFYIIDKPKNKFIVNHFVFSTGVADWIEKKYIKEGKKPTPKKYWQNVAIDFETRKKANEYITREFKTI